MTSRWFEPPRYDGRIRAVSRAALARQKSDGGSAFRVSAGDAPVGNPGDPLIGFPIAFSNPTGTLLLAHRGQLLRICCVRLLRCDAITEGHSPARDGGNTFPWQ